MQYRQLLCWNRLSPLIYFQLEYFTYNLHIRDVSVSENVGVSCFYYEILAYFESVHNSCLRLKIKSCQSFRPV